MDETVPNDVPTTAKRRAGQFAPGNKAAVKPKAAVPAPYSGSDPLSDMRYAMSTAPAAGETQGQKAARKLFKEDYAKFLVQFERLEKLADERARVERERSEAEKKGAGEAVKPGEKEANIDALIDRVVKELGNVG